MSEAQWLGTGSAWATGANWVSTSAPVDADTANFDEVGTGPLVASDQSATELAALKILSTFTYNFGDNGSAMKVDATLVEIGQAAKGSTAGSHSPRINLWLPDIDSTILVFGTKASQGTDAGKEPVRIKTGTQTGNKLIMSGGGKVGIATDSLGDTAKFAEIACLHNSATINIGSGTTLTTWRQKLGIGNIFAAATSLFQEGGTLNTYGSGAYTTIECAGTCNLGSAGTITNLNVNKGGNANLLVDSRVRTVTTVKLYPGSTLSYDPAIVTITNPIQIIGGKIRDVTINTPSGITVAIVKT